ncbi:hypothetical protein RCL1_004346 [Eukaryota sp. TZLM3-RCL]
MFNNDLPRSKLVKEFEGPWSSYKERLFTEWSDLAATRDEMLLQFHPRYRATLYKKQARTAEAPEKIKGRRLHWTSTEYAFLAMFQGELRPLDLLKLNLQDLGASTKNSFSTKDLIWLCLEEFVDSILFTERSHARNFEAVQSKKKRNMNQIT